MIELTTNEFAGVLALLAGVEQQVLPYAICERNNPGRIFADQRENPHTALIWSPVGYYFLAGNPAHIRDLKKISQVLTEVFGFRNTVVEEANVDAENNMSLIRNDRDRITALQGRIKELEQEVSEKMGAIKTKEKEIAAINRIAALFASPDA